MFGSGSSPFGSKSNKRKTPDAGLFGMPAPSPIGSTAPTHHGFGSSGETLAPVAANAGGTIFGSAVFGGGGGASSGGSEGNSAATPQFGQERPITTSNSTMFGQNISTTTTSLNPLFGATSGPKFGMFGKSPATGSLFAEPSGENKTKTMTAAPLFGKHLVSVPSNTSSASNVMFGDSSVVRSASTRPNTPVFGESVGLETSDAAFGSNNQAGITTSAPSLFGGTASSTISSSVLFSTTTLSDNPALLFGGGQDTTTPSLFGSQPPTTSSNPVFGVAGAEASGSTLFGASVPSPTNSSLFGVPPVSESTATSLFGGNPTTTSSTPIFGATSSPGGGTSPPKTKKLGATAKFLLEMKGEKDVGGGGLFGDKGGSGAVFGQKVSGSSGLFGEKDGGDKGSGGLFGEKSEMRTKYSTGLFTENTTGENVFNSQQTRSGPSVFEGSSSLFKSNAGPDFSRGGKEEESPLFSQNYKPSIKSRLGTLGATNREEEDGSVFSKPRLVRTAIFGKTENLGEMEGKRYEDRELSETESEVSDGGTRRPRMERTVSKEELSTITSIRCEVVPDVINKTVILSKHFSKFGEVTRVFPNLKKKTAIIHFTDHKSAKLAKSKGKIVNPKVPPIGHIFYSQSSPGKSKIKRPEKRSEVEEELASMGGSTEFNIEKSEPIAKKKTFRITKAINARPSEDVEVSEEPPSRIQGASELLAVMKQQTFSDSDRWSVLEARDKYIRLKKPKQQIRAGEDLENQNLVGTCPDFCPEKERYGRSAKNQLRWFEKDCGKLNHLAAVKEHSRSAADQDVPLSHELRPPPVLSKTMDFLMCNIVDRIDHMVGTMSDWFQFIDQLSLQSLLPSDPMSQFSVLNPEYTGETVGDWFEFMWSVTRAIRKDITQQNSSDLVSLSIVEKCARFHIFCAERLCEEDAHNFDRKLNDENLTKCLRTLKHMYYDLSLECVVGPKENEFRAYDILMNLNEGDTLREVQTFPEELRRDPRVQFSLKCVSALKNNNYVMFFKLVKKATFLEACILKRYFYQVRRQALETIQRAFTPGKDVVQFPTQKIVDMLGFESITECGRFLRLHGIEYEGETVYLERGTFMYPETAPPMYRSLTLIGNKKSVSFGEIMNGGPLNDNPYLDYFPHDSFDDAGFLKVESFEAKDQEVIVSPEELEKMQREEELKQEQAEVASEIISAMTQEVCELEARLICENVLDEAKNEKIAVEIVEILERECVNEEIDLVVVETLRKARNDLIAKRMIENQKAEDELAACNDIIIDWVDEIIGEVGSEEMMEVSKRRKLQKYLVLADKVSADLINDIVAKDVREIAATAILEAEKEKEEKIRIFKERGEKKFTKKVFSEWRRLARKSASQKAAVLNFPAGPANLSSREQNTKLGWSKTSVQQRHLSLESIMQGRQDLELMIRSRDIEDAIIHSAVLEPFHLLDWLKAQDDASLQESTRWKLLFSCPEVEDDSVCRPYLEMLRRKFRKSMSSSQELESGLLGCHIVPNCSVCIREVGPADLEQVTYSEKHRRKVFGGTSCVMFVFLDTEETEEKAKERLEAVLVNRPRIPPVPLAVLTNMELGRTGDSFGLIQLVSDGLIASYDVFKISTNIFDITQSVRLGEAVKTLINKMPQDPASLLTIKPLNDYVADFLTSYVFTEFYSNLRDRRSRDLLDRPATDLISLYNSALDHLVETAVDESLQEISWPAQEFSGHRLESEIPLNWNESQYINNLVADIERLKLPELEVYETNTWKNLVEQVLVYLDNILVPEVDSSIVVSSITRSMSRCYRNFLSRCTSQWGGLESVPPPEVLPWTDIVHSCIMYQMSTLDNKSNICYKDSSLSRYTLPDEWRAGLGWGGEHLMDSMWEVVNTTVNEARERTIVEQGDTCLNSELKEILSKEQRQSARFEKMLEDAVEENCANNFSLSGQKSLKVSEMEDDTEDQKCVESDGSADVSTSQFVPLISYLSPTLGRLVSPYQVLTRQEMSRTGMSPRYSRNTKLFTAVSSTSVNTSKRKAELSVQSNKKSMLSRSLSLSPESRPLRMDLDQKLDTLKVGLNNDLEQDLRFERMLQAALN